jgi:feruloyl esterase
MNAKKISLHLLVLAAIAIWPAAISAQNVRPAVSPTASCASLMSLSLPNTQIISATEQSTPVAYCNVIGVINKRVSSQDPDHFTYGIGFELNLPDSWVGRFEMMGGGGTDGSVSNPVGSAGTATPHSAGLMMTTTREAQDTSASMSRRAWITVTTPSKRPRKFPS